MTEKFSALDKWNRIRGIPVIKAWEEPEPIWDAPLGAVCDAARTESPVSACVGILSRLFVERGLTPLCKRQEGDRETSDSVAFSDRDAFGVEFRIAQIPGFRFGIWASLFESKDDRGLEFVSATLFWQCEEWMDKFKPSRSEYCYDIRFRKSPEGWEADEAEANCALEAVSFAKKHRWLASYRDLTGIDYNSRRVSGLLAWASCMRQAVGTRIYERFIHKEALRSLGRAGRIARRHGYDICVLDNGDSASPRYEIVLGLPKGTFDADCAYLPDSGIPGLSEIGKALGKEKDGYLLLLWTTGPLRIAFRETASALARALSGKNRKPGVPRCVSEHATIAEAGEPFEEMVRGLAEIQERRR